VQEHMCDDGVTSNEIQSTYPAELSYSQTMGY